MMKTNADKNQLNPLCRKCVRTCRQPLSVVLCDCKRFQPYPFKIPRHQFDQIDLFSPPGLPPEDSD